MSDLLGSWGAGLERRVRLWGIGLFLFAPIVLYAADFIAVGYSLLDATWVLGRLAVSVLAPAGATLIAVSLVVRGVTRGVTSRFVRSQLVAGIGLLVLGLVSVLYGNDAIASIDEYLGPTGRPAALFLGPVARLIGVGAFPLGVALLATAPLYRLADIRNSYRDLR